MLLKLSRFGDHRFRCQQCRMFWVKKASFQLNWHLNFYCSDKMCTNNRYLTCFASNVQCGSLHLSSNVLKYCSISATKINALPLEERRIHSADTKDLSRRRHDKDGPILWCKQLGLKAVTGFVTTLASYTGSGNSWLRYILQQDTCMLAHL